MAPFLPLTTERLLLRAFRPDDAEPFAAYRSEPDIARYQSWSAPYAVAEARRLIADVSAMDGPLRWRVDPDRRRPRRRAHR